MNVIEIIAGVDEAGRGPLAGPVFAAAVILDPGRPIDGLADSKKLSAKRREELKNIICEQSSAWSVASADVHEIDRINILQASLLAMQRAVQKLTIMPTLALIDGNKCPQLPCQARGIIKGDATVAAISAASILAKVARDQLMLEMDLQYPGYGFAQHKGYGTQQHMDAIRILGITPIHRMSFMPMRQKQLETD